MSTRFRLPSSGAAVVSPALQSYTHTGTTRRPLPTATVGDSSTLTTTAIAPDGADHIAAGDTFHAQFVSAPLAAGIVFTTLQTVKFALQCLEANAGNNLVIQIWVGVYDSAGTTLQATLRSKASDGTELATSIQNRTHNVVLSGGYTTVANDRLVVELSVVGTPTAAGGVQGHNASLRFGSNGAGGDLAENDTEAGATFNPWIEFSADIAAPTTYPITPTGVLTPAGVVTMQVQRAFAGAFGGASALLDDLVAYWALDEASGTRADAHGANDLTDVNTVGSTTGVIGTAASFVSGSAESLRYTGSAFDLSTTDSWSASFWIYKPVGTGDGWRAILAAGTGGGNQKVYFLVYAISPYYVYRYDVFHNNTTLATGAWTHIVYTFASGGVNTGTEIFYTNGTQTNTRTGAVPAPSTGQFRLGVDGEGGGTHYFQGYIDEVGFWARTLTPGEVSDLYTTGAGLAYPFGGGGLAGALTTVELQSVSLTGALTPAGTVTKSVIRAVAGALTPVGTLFRLSSKLLAGAFAGGGGGAVFTDDFTRADSDTVGGNWVETSGDWDIGSNALTMPDAAAAGYLLTNTTAIGTADYDVEAEVFVPGGQCGPGLIGRYTAGPNYYLAHCNDDVSTNRFELYSVVGGAFTLLGSYDPVATINNGTFTLKLSLQGTAIKVYVDDVERISVTNSAVTAEGDFGARCYQPGSGGFVATQPAWDNFAVYTAGGGAAAIAGALTAVRLRVASLSGALTPAGTVGKSTARQVAGALIPSGALTRRLARALGASLTPVAVLTRSLARTLSAALTPTAVTTPEKIAGLLTVSLTGALTPAGTVAQRVARSLTAAALPAGTLTRQTRRSLTGALVPAGTLTKRLARSLAAALTPTGTTALTRVALLALAGALTPAGSLVRRVGKALTAALTPSGATGRLATLSLVLTGTLTPIGTTTKQLARALTAALTPVATLRKALERLLGGATVPAGDTELLTGAGLPSPPLGQPVGAAVVTDGVYGSTVADTGVKLGVAVTDGVVGGAVTDNGARHGAVVDDGSKLAGVR